MKRWFCDNISSDQKISNMFIWIINYYLNYYLYNYPIKMSYLDVSNSVGVCICDYILRYISKIFLLLFVFGYFFILIISDEIVYLDLMMHLIEVTLDAVGIHVWLCFLLVKFGISCCHMLHRPWICSNECIFCRLLLCKLCTLCISSNWNNNLSLT